MNPHTFTPTDRQYLLRCMQLAQQGRLTCAPNPMVGAVVVGPDGRILGEGYHIRAGEGHAEVNALGSVSRQDWPLLQDSTIYVSLEPCAHYGRTPPCAELIIRRRLKRCVIGCQDPFSRVNGQGISMLQQAGVEVVLAPDDIRRECLMINRHFICQHRLGRPYITLKWAQTADGYIGHPHERVYISNEQSRMWGHRLRATHQAIVVGHGTLQADQPRLDIRHWAHAATATPRLQTGTFVLGRVSEEELPHGWQAFAHIDDLLEHLQRSGMQSLLVEGGSQVLQSFIERDLWDEAWAEQSPNALPSHLDPTQAIAAPEMPAQFRPHDEHHLGRHFSHWQSPLLDTLYGLI